LPRCLDALAPTLGPDDELIVFDNASSDSSTEIARTRGAVVMRAEKNLGYGGANNRAALSARGRYLVFLNQDTEVEPGWLDGLLAPLAEHPGLATAKIVFIDRPDLIDACGNAVHVSGITVSRGHGAPASAFPDRERLGAISGAAFAIDRASWERLGGFDESFFMYFEDTDLSLRAALAGLPLWYVPESRIRHRHIPSFGPRKLYWLERNRWRTLLKLWSGTTLLALLPHLLLMELLVWGYALLGGGEAVRAKASAYGWLAQHAWIVLRARLDTQRLRAVTDRELLTQCKWRLDLSELIASNGLRRAAECALVGPMWLATVWARLLVPHVGKR
jgi:GT2 family glycosyltransferase